MPQSTPGELRQSENATTRETELERLSQQLANDVSRLAQQGKLQKDEFVDELRPVSRQRFEEAMWRDLARGRSVGREDDAVDL